jgi:hypothetical protein
LRRLRDCRAIIFALLFAFTACSPSELEFIYCEESDGYILAGYSGTETHIDVPAAHKGKPVVEINVFLPMFPDVTVCESSAYFAMADGVLFSKDLTTLVRLPKSHRGHYVVPEGVTTVTSYAFAGHATLTGVTLPDSLESPLDFSGCTALESLYIPAGVTPFFVTLTDGEVIPWYSNFLRGTVALQSIEVCPDSRYFSSVDGVLFSKDGNTLTAYPAARTDTEYSVPDGVEVLAFASFADAAALETIRIPASVNSTERAFWNNPALKRIYIDMDEADALNNIQGIHGMVNVPNPPVIIYNDSVQTVTAESESTETEPIVPPFA